VEFVERKLLYDDGVRRAGGIAVRNYNAARVLKCACILSRAVL
jgi:hypothetical protein